MGTTKETEEWRLTPIVVISFVPVAPRVFARARHVDLKVRIILSYLKAQDLFDHESKKLRATPSITPDSRNGEGSQGTLATTTEIRSDERAGGSIK
ncbi:hypothetical protein RvY_11823 [Ramazzottius varieornatus]|uniref:Uncharacterized protein n=1 Tax=Ramazzottius varieornatus TaxID=947166 RepID=A0A1D1VHE4_RAMVA|nr:hypothetical protein RvY_11823 [Ramazzottius varieornatus]